MVFGSEIDFGICLKLMMTTKNTPSSPKCVLDFHPAPPSPSWGQNMLICLGPHAWGHHTHGDTTRQIWATGRHDSRHISRYTI